MTFFNSDDLQNKDVCIVMLKYYYYSWLYVLFFKIINQCGYVNIRREIFDNDQKFPNEYRNLLPLLDKQIMSMKQSLQMYRSFWLMLPEQICKSDGISASDKQICWTGSSISQDKR